MAETALRPLNRHNVTHDSHLAGGYSMVAEAMIKIQCPPPPPFGEIRKDSLPRPSLDNINHRLMHSVAIRTAH